MDKLLEAQGEFATAIRDFESPPPSSVARTPAGALPIRRFSVYRNNVVMSLTEVLEAYFPVVRRLVGDEYFRAMARFFIVTEPPATPVLSQYGAGFPAFIASFEPVSDLPYLADVALMEWLQQRAYHSPEGVPLTAEHLSQVNAEDVAALRLVFHPAARFLSSSSPVFSIWRTNTFDADVVPVGADAGPEAVLIVRPEMEVKTLLLQAGTAMFVDRLMQGATIGEAYESALEQDSAFDPAPALAALIELGALIEASSQPIKEATRSNGGSST
ncbi:MAG: DNA-binding domain-containing protein [Alphaproteobacteria bacterium]|nr:DNA-binding domain-containing protein [Alphaproteobacteria bacterium]